MFCCMSISDAFATDASPLWTIRCSRIRICFLFSWISCSRFSICVLEASGSFTDCSTRRLRVLVLKAISPASILTCSTRRSISSEIVISSAAKFEPLMSSPACSDSEIMLPIAESSSFHLLDLLCLK
uniref:Uncharacterized protein n=1 Tax=Opuntia streptacantha TaxID=393608 RepID=A0A7C9E1Q0_OPUST